MSMIFFNFCVDKSMFKNPTNYIKYGLLALPVFFGVIDFYNTFTTEYSLNFTKYLEMSASQASRWMVVCIIFSLIAFLTSTIFSVKWNRSLSQLRRINIKSIKNINLYFKVIFLAIATYKIVYIVGIGVLNFFLMARLGQAEIGGLLYFTFIMFPFILAYDISENGFSWSNTLSLAALCFINLVTGFRILLIYAFVLIIIFNFQAVMKVKKFTIIIAVSVLALFLLAYEASRQQIEANGLELEVQSSMDSLNRSKPLNTLQLIELKEVSLTLTDATKLFTVPIATLFKTFGVEYDDFINIRFNLDRVYEPLFRDYLVWRGTPSYEATGSSISIVSYSYLFYQELGVIIFAFFYGFFIAVGCKLLDSNVYERKILGTTILVATFLCNESVVEATGLFVYSLIFLVFMWFLAIYRQTIIKGQR